MVCEALVLLSSFVVLCFNVSDCFKVVVDQATTQRAQQAHVADYFQAGKRVTLLCHLSRIDASADAGGALDKQLERDQVLSASVRVTLGLHNHQRINDNVQERIRHRACSEQKRHELYALNFVFVCED